MPPEHLCSTDVVVVGGGPAGLSAALVLGRALRRVLVVDAGAPRNAWSESMHGFLSRDGMAPAEFLAAARQELLAYPSIELRPGHVDAIARTDSGRFVVTDDRGSRTEARKVLLATGVVDHLPRLPRFDEFYGVSIHHCPYCDGYEHRGHPMVVLGPAGKCAGMALMMTRWSNDITFVPDPAYDVPEATVRVLGDAGVGLVAEPIADLEGDGRRLSAVVFASGRRVPCRALFFNTGQHQRSHLLAALGVASSERGGAVADSRAESNVPGVFVAGDATRDVQFVVVAAAEGATAAVSIDRQLMDEDGLLKI